MSTLKVLLADLLSKTLAKCGASQKSASRLVQEYDNLEQVGPAPGQPGQQHDKMVRNKLCKRASANEDKNRYCNLFPFDTNVYNFPGSSDKYINASWIDLEEGKGSKYIVTMAPLDPQSFSYNEDSTVPDFWQMCWETKVPAIVMLCTVSPGFAGCSQYFPDSPGSVVKYGDFTVTHVKTVEKTVEGFLTREFTLRKEGETAEHKMTQFHYKAWPNYGVPQLGVTDFVTYVYEQTQGSTAALQSNGSPRLVIHCSGGIGRSGTFLSAFHACCKLRELCDGFGGGGAIEGGEESCGGIFTEDGVCLENTVMKMRTQRHPWMVEGLHQYRVAYEIVIQMIRNQLQLLSGESSDL